jgi:hypothetical protein
LSWQAAIASVTCRLVSFFFIRSLALVIVTEMGLSAPFRELCASAKRALHRSDRKGMREGRYAGNSNDRP